MKELTCKNCGSTDFTKRADQMICDYCQSAYDVEVQKLDEYSYLLEKQKLEYAQERRLELDKQDKKKRAWKIAKLVIKWYLILFAAVMVGLIIFVIVLALL